MTARHAAQAALQDEAAALLVDVAGPVMFVVEGDDLRPPLASLTFSEGARLSTDGIRALVPLCLTDPPWRAGGIRQAEASSHPHRPKLAPGRRVKVTGLRDRCRRTPVTEASVRRAEAFLHVGAEMRR